MRKYLKQPGRLVGALLLGLACVLPWSQSQAAHDIRGITGPTFNLYAFPFNMNLPEGTSLHMWGFGDMDAGAHATHPEGVGYQLPQYPAPTLIVTEDQTVTINLTNYGVPDPVSIVVTGHNLNASGGTPGLVTNTSSGPGETVTYTFTAPNPGTYVYHSLDGDNPGLHAEMGLQGVLIVQPADGSRSAYGAGTGTDYDQENLYLMTEIDPEIHLQMERGHVEHFTQSDRYATVWFINGRVFPDLFQGDYNPVLPHQPYESLVQAHPGDRVLVRNVNVGSDSHPMHYHGENLTFVGRDGRMLSSDGLVADLGRSDNTINSAPKQSIDAIWTWTGKDLGWDIYGYDTTHSCKDTNPADGWGDADADYPGEYCADHNKPIPVQLPGVSDLALGGWWSGSPFLGDVGDLPPGEGGLNPFGGYFLVWHSHNEKELTTFNIFPGGTLGAVVVLPPYVVIQ
ncbi:MAG: multicopper oxidase domain-containing protein [Chromatiales bacterium]|jgi:FtsP/CotA-like multicopper oxidase with cupredoxin domain